MKKLLSVLLAIVLTVATVPAGAATLNVSAACSKHTYTNACDAVCNVCNSKRIVTSHDYENCFDGREDNVKYLGEWQKTPLTTGIFSIEPVVESQDFTSHYVLVADKNGSQVRFNENAQGWPLVKNQGYTIRLFCQYDDTPISNIDFKLVQTTETVFSDVGTTQWYNDPVIYNVGAGFMSGYGGTTQFGPADNIQRQDFMVILARVDGVDLTQYKEKASPFTDVPEDPDCYYKAAVIWGRENGIVTGYSNSTKFGVGDKITREQLVTFLYRYAKYKGIDVSATLEAEQYVSATYADFNAVTDYAKSPIIWAIEKGVIKGKTKTAIAPHGNALRCETAQILYNNHQSGIIPTVKLCLHSYQEATCTAPKTCSGCGKTIGFPKSHSYNDATCQVPRTCKDCGATTGPLGNHSYSDATCAEPETCTVCGATRGEPLPHHYVYGECDYVVNGQVCGHYSESYCPKLYFTGDMSEITKESQRDKNITCNIAVQYRSREQIIDCTGKIKIQGSSSTAYCKKNYTLTFYEDSSYSDKLGVDVGWGAQTKYCLKANWIDKTHSRNVVTAKLVGEMQRKYGLFATAPNNGAIDGFPVEVFINGEFHGLYTMNIPKDEWQFDMDKNNPDHIVICGDNWNDPVKFLAIPENLNDWTVEVGPEDDATLQKVQRLVDFVLNSSDEEFKANFDQYLNLDSTLNYYIMFNYAWLSDNTGKNMLLATYDGKVWYPSLYDLDTSWGTHWNGGSTYDYSKGTVWLSNSVLWQRFEALYSKEIAERYFELRQDVLDPEHVMDTFNSFSQSIPQEVLARETNKWNTEEHPIPGYDFSQIQHYLGTVIPRLDERYSEWL